MPVKGPGSDSTRPFSIGLKNGNDHRRRCFKDDEGLPDLDLQIV